MQQAPYRLSQTLWTAFRAAKPISRPIPQRLLQRRSRIVQSPRFAVQIRSYSDKTSEIDRKVEKAKEKIDESIQGRAEATLSQPQTNLKDDEQDTIIHTNPEASSIVEPHAQRRQNEPTLNSPPPPSPSSSTPPSSSSHSLRLRFSTFMDSFQTHLFTASRRLNDLTGYTSIESLKNDITNQESLVSTYRTAVKTARANYANTIATRSTTQREVNDLLHRKHTWSPADLERFTSLYRSDHANEQSEAKAQTDVAEAEQRYEEASTKLGRTILARYHEEQIWSDKIRQMSTWGTWGLMGLNVLLFIVFQIAIEPWRRKRLVTGFEEKVELALKERDEELVSARQQVKMLASAPLADINLTAQAQSQGIRPGATAEGKAETIANNIATHIVDAVTGSSPPPSPSSAGSTRTAPSKASLEEAAEAKIAQELNATPALDDINTSNTSTFIPSSTSNAGTSSYTDSLRALWSEDKHLVLTQKEMTTRVLEGIVGGAAVMGLLMAVLRPR